MYCDVVERLAHNHLEVTFIALNRQPQALAPGRWLLGTCCALAETWALGSHPQHRRGHRLIKCGCCYAAGGQNVSADHGRVVLTQESLSRVGAAL